MDDQPIDARRANRRGQGVERDFRVLIVDADAAFHRHGNRNRRLHRGDAFADQRRLAHQAGAEGAALDTIGRAAAIQIDLAVTEIGADPRGFGKQLRIVAAELQRDGMLHRVEADQALPVAMDDRERRHHLGVEQRMARHQAMDRPAMPVGPIHHRRDGEAHGRERRGHGRSPIAFGRVLHARAAALTSWRGRRSASG